MDSAIFIGLWTAFDLMLMLTGKLVVPLATFGQWRGERLMQNEARIYAPAGALSFLRDGKRVITGLGLSVVGGLFYVVSFFFWAALS